MTRFTLPGWRKLAKGSKQLRYELSRSLLPAYSPKRGQYVPEQLSVACSCGGHHQASAETWAGVDRPIFFTYRHGTEWAAAIQLRAFQVSRMLVTLGSSHPVVVQPIENLARAKPRNAVIIVGRTAVRPASETMLRQFMSDGNLIAFDMVDGQVSSRIESLPHAYVCSSLSEEAERSSAGHTTIVSLMSPDQRCPLHDFSGKKFGIGYHGLAKNVQHAAELPEISVVPYSERAPAPGELPMPVGWDEMATFSHHYSVRAWNPGDGFKPLMKAFVASRLGACFIGSADDPEATRVLPADYPYLARSSRIEDVREIFDYAKKTYRTPVWEQAVSAMMALREKSCPANTALQLVSGISMLIKTTRPDSTSPEAGRNT